MDEPNFKVSIIVPVYNQIKYLIDCLDSIVNQTYEYLEIIVVDDGSTDGSEKICDKYATMDSRITVIHKENGGLVSAWKKGIDVCCSDFVAFVDSDDRISKDYIKLLVREQIRTKADLVATGIQYFSPDGATRKYLYNVPTKYFSKKDLEHEVYPILINTGKFQDRGIHTSRCGKLIKTDLIKMNMKYVRDKVTYEEDFNVMIPIFLDMDSLCVIDNADSVYYVRQNPVSMTHNYDANMLSSIRYVFESLEYVIDGKPNNVRLHLQLEAEYLDAMIQHYKNMLLYPDSTLKCIKKLRSLYINNIKLEKAIEDIDWEKYRLLNRIIIFCMKNPDKFYFTWITSILRLLKMKRYISLKRQDIIHNG